MLAALQYWHWLILGLLLLVAEAFVPGASFLWFGASALCVGIVLIALPGLPVPVQLALFAVLAFASIAAWRAWKRSHPEASTHPDLNRRGRQYIGRRFTLTEPLRDGHCQLHVDDTVWRAQSSVASVPAGVQVEVVAIEGATLLIEPVERV
ncbi:MAG: NfeD family protein [Gammaproteobacteria bacterium]